MDSEWRIKVRVNGERHVIITNKELRSGELMEWDGRQYVVNAISIKPRRHEEIIHLIPKEIDFFFTK